MLKSKNIIFCTTLFIIFTSKVFSQIKIGYVLSERIRTEYEEFKDAESQLQLELKKSSSRIRKNSS